MDEYLTELYFVDERIPDSPQTESPLCTELRGWIDAYFAGKNPPMNLPLNPSGTDFQKMVWNALLQIPYGQTLSYGALAQELHTSPRAIGGATGRNKIILLIPCHRVIGATGALVGFGAGLARKEFLLDLEKES